MDTETLLALEDQQAGRYADAARLYHALLIREPNHVDALHLFGVMHHQCGHASRALELIGKAVALRPGAAAFHSNLSEVFRCLGEYEAAVRSAREAIRLQDNYPEAANNLGLALQALGQREDAVDAFRKAIRMRPGFALGWNNLGTVLRELERDDEAINAFRSAIELDPTQALARANLGQSLVDRGEPQEGLTHCLEAVRLQPDLAAAHNNLGNAYRALERWSESHSAYAEALRLSPGMAHARLHANLGLALKEDGERAQAFACLRRATELAPEDAGVWRSLATAHADDEDYKAAIPCCERVVELNPSVSQDYNNLGWAYQQEGRHGEAAQSYRRALEISPNSPEPLLNLGGLHEELGEMVQAEVCYRQALSTSDASFALARLATLLRGRLPEEDRGTIRTHLVDPSLGDDPRASLLFGLAHVCDALGDYAEAADCLKPANALMLARRIRRNRGYDPDEHAQFVNRVIAGFSEEFFGRLAGAGDPTQRPIFIMGMPRSGTTLVEQVLASHPGIHGTGELRLARQSFESIPEVVGRNDGIFPCLAALDAGGVRELSRRHLEELERIADHDETGNLPKRIVNKMPDNYLHLGLLAILFPEATFIHVRRDRRDVALSCWMTSFRSIRWANDIDHIATRFREHRRLMAHWRTSLPAPLHEVIYENLINDFEGEARRLIELCSMPWNPTCLDFHHNERPIRTASVTQVRQPLYRRSIARWRNYETHLAKLFDRLPID